MADHNGPDIGEAVLSLRPMRVQSLWIENFRGLEDLHVPFPQQGSTVIVGPNGAGKSTVLQAIDILLARFTDRLSSTSSVRSTIEDQDIKNGSSATSLKIAVQLGSGEVTWIVAKTRKGFPVMNSSNLSLMGGLVKDWQEGNAKVNRVQELPFVYYYKVDRSITDIPSRIHKPKDSSRFSIYSAGRPTGSLNFRDFLYWYKEKQHQELQQGVKLAELEMVRTAIADVIPGYANPRFIADGSNRFELTNSKGEALVINNLSDGERTLITLVADIAKRGAMALEGNEDLNLQQIFGVVLIDEIELHLHPKWQSQIIQSLEKTFPNIQFIATTHSPAVLTNVPDTNSYALLDGQLFSPRSFGRTSDALLEDVFDAPSSNEIVEKQFDALNSLIDDHKFSAARELLEQLRDILPDDHRVAAADVMLWMPAE